ncbi:hypothetical protein [Pseudoclavibacter sp. RFBB5]|uniref:hypothetical protein n=1 Tax=Pseudoclavibacter sp. RFBB5 TaxID=2080574 RepID=UPI000CE7B354|nr:hypothetical protein [Pseudoclavibacter sp. RFBB5]PPG29678.1 hypothetical protein C5B97_11960 [Pseudoclavibacter sp. RFBB5]
MTPLQSWALMGCLFAVAYALYRACRICIEAADALDDLEELEVDPYDRDTDPFGYIDEETDRHRDQQVADEAIEAGHG